MAIARAALDERLDALPGLPARGLGLQHVQLLALLGGEDRVVAELERLARRAVAVAEGLLDGLRGVLRVHQRAERRGRERVDLGRMGVGRGVQAGAGDAVEAAADPVRALAPDLHRRVARADLQLDHAGAVVEAARGVEQHVGRRPALGVADRDLPEQRRVLGVDAGAARGRRVHVDLQQQVRQRAVEAEVEGVADHRRGAERRLVGALGPRAALGDADVLERARAVHDVGDRLDHRDGDLGRGLEDDRRLRRRARGADLEPRGQRDRLLRRRGQAEAEHGLGGARRLHLQPDQAEQRHVHLVGDAVQAVDDHLGHPREQLDERDAGVRDVVLGPLGARLPDPQARLGDQLLERPVVERDLWEPHAPSSAGMR